MVSWINRVRFGERLREERKRLGLSQAELAALVSKDRKTQERYETGQRSPTADYLMSAAEHGVDVLYLLTGERAGEPAHSEICPVEVQAEPNGP